MAKKGAPRTGQETKAGFISTELKTPDIPDYVVVELRYESPVAFTRSKFAAPADGASQAETLNNVLAKYDIQTLQSHFGLPASAVKARIDVAACLPPEPEPKKYAKKGMDTEFIESGFVLGHSHRGPFLLPSRPVRRPAAATSSPHKATSTPHRRASARSRSGDLVAPRVPV